MNLGARKLAAAALSRVSQAANEVPTPFTPYQARRGGCTCEASSLDEDVVRVGNLLWQVHYINLVNFQVIDSISDTPC